MQLKCVDACIICDIDGFSGRNDNGGVQDEGDRPGVGANDFCTTINHNIQWIGFLANSEDLKFTITVSNCEEDFDFGFGLEAGVFEVIGCDLEGAIRRSNCNTDMDPRGWPEGFDGVHEFEANDLVLGDYYYLVIDGNNSDICDYVINVTEGTTKVPDVTGGEVIGEMAHCGPTTATYRTAAIRGAPFYDWTLDGEPIGASNALEVDVTFPADGVYTICRTAANVCAENERCIEVTVGAPDDVEETYESCYDEPVVVNGVSYDATGVYEQTLTGPGGCTYEGTYDVTILPEIKTSITELICDGDAFTFDGRALTTAGTYTAVLKSEVYPDCDSTVTLTLTVSDCSFVPFADPKSASCPGAGDGSIVAGVNGPPATYGLRYRRAGATDYTDLALEPDGTPVTIPGLRAGVYELVWTSSIAADIERSVVVTEPAALPPAADITGEPDLCVPGSANYSTTDVPGATAYTWTLDGDPVGTPNQLEQTIDFPAAGVYEVCVQVADACGVGEPACLEVNVGSPITERVALPPGCAGASVTSPSGAVYTADGEYPESLKTEDGRCDSMVTYVVTIVPEITTAITNSICNGDVFTFDGRDLTTANDYTAVLKSERYPDCDSTVTLTLVVDDCSFRPFHGPEPATCPGGSDGAIVAGVTGPPATYGLRYRLEGATDYTDLALDPDGTAVTIPDLPAGHYELIFTSSIAEDISRTVEVTEPAPLSPTADVTGPPGLCEAGSATYSTTAVPGATAYAWTLDGAPVGTPDELTQTINFPSAGTYEVCVQAANACGSSAPACTPVTVGSPSDTEVPLPPGCAGESVASPSGAVYTASGEYEETITLPGGCSATVTYIVTIVDPIEISIAELICRGDAFTFDGRDLTEADVYTGVFKSKIYPDCDSTVTLTLTVSDCSFRPSATPKPATCPGVSDGAIVVGVTGAPATYTLRYRPAGTTDDYTELSLDPDGTAVTIPDLPAGHYELIFTSSIAEDISRTVEVTEPAPLSPTPDVTGPLGLCEVGSATYSTSAVPGATTYAWTLDGAPVGTPNQLEQTINFPAPGTYQVCLQVADACSANEPVCIPVSVGTPVPTRVELPPGCAGESVTSPSGTLYTASGEYEETVPLPGGCLAVVTYVVTILPEIKTSITEPICDGDAFTFDGRALTTAGTYTAALKSEVYPDCDSTVTLTLTVSDCSFRPFADPRPATCPGMSDGAIVAGVTGPAATYTLRYRPVGTTGDFTELALNPDGTAVTIPGLPTGPYELIWTSSIAPDRERTVRITEPAPLTLAIEARPRGSFDVTCAGGDDGVLTASASGGTGALTYTWDNGNVGPVNAGLSVGPQRVTVTDENGCPIADDYQLTEPPPIALRARGLPEGCDPLTEPGSVVVTELAGGQPPLQMFIRPSERIYTRSGTYGFPAGDHGILAVDRVGCRTDTSVTIASTPKAYVSAPADTLFVRPRTTVELRPTYGGPIAWYDWRGDGTLDCDDCAFPVAAPETDTTYEITVATTDDCRDTARLVIALKNDPSLYAPNAISPNGDGVNDAFTIFAAEPDATIETLEVYDRWGERVFTTEDIRASDPSLGWDGTSRGQDMNGAVFVYWARVRFPDGEEQFLKGDLTVVR